MKKKLYILIVILLIGFGYSYYQMFRTVQEMNTVIQYLKTPQANGFNGFEISVFQSLNHYDEVKK